jgi:hypothetical protein
VATGEVDLQYCPTDQMIGDFYETFAGLQVFLLQKDYYGKDMWLTFEGVCWETENTRRRFGFSGYLF